jgi:16S rRNA pseudouridine516 synthase
MSSKRHRLDRFLSTQLGIKRGDVRGLLAAGRVIVDGCVATEINQVIDQFSLVSFDQQVLQARQPSYVMMNKPMGVVSATKDHKNKTVIELLDRDDREQLHIAGRLDFNSSGLLLLTNDGRWSRQLSLPERQVSKLYRVTLSKKITPEYVDAFATGMYFAYEDITTRPAKLTIVSDYVAEVRLVEGRYHQIKRMFARFQNKVLTLHRLSVGQLWLDEQLLPGQSRDLTVAEVNNIAAECLP